MKGLAGAVLLAPRLGANRWLAAAEKVRDKLKITEIQRYEIYLPYHDFNATNLFRYHGYRIQANTVLLVKTNVGLVGAGQSWGVYEVTDKQRRKYIGTNPFDWLASRSDLPFNMAMYGLMGKYLDIPAWKLIGEKVRDRIPVSAWTASFAPDMMAKEVKPRGGVGLQVVEVSHRRSAECCGSNAGHAGRRPARLQDSLRLQRQLGSRID